MCAIHNANGDTFEGEDVELIALECPWCGRWVQLCRDCARRRVYCGAACTEAAREQSKKRARAKYAESEEGRLDNRDRQARFRAAQRARADGQGAVVGFAAPGEIEDSTESQETNALFFGSISPSDAKDGGLRVTDREAQTGEAEGLDDQARRASPGGGRTNPACEEGDGAVVTTASTEESALVGERAAEPQAAEAPSTPAVPSPEDVSKSPKAKSPSFQSISFTGAEGSSPSVTDHRGWLPKNEIQCGIAAKSETLQPTAPRAATVGREGRCERCGRRGRIVGQKVALFNLRGQAEARAYPDRKPPSVPIP